MASRGIPTARRLYSAGAGQNNVQEFNYANGVITRARTFSLPADRRPELRGRPGDQRRTARRCTSTRVFAQTVSAIDLDVGPGDQDRRRCRPSRTARVVSADGRMLYVSLWGGASVQVYMLPSMILLEEFAHRRAPERAGAVARRQAAVRRLRQQRLGLGVRHVLGRSARTDFDEPAPERAANLDAQLAGALAGRPDADRVDRRQQRRRRRRREQRRTQHRQRLRADRLVSDRRHLQQRRQADLRPERQGAGVGAPSRPTTTARCGCRARSRCCRCPIASRSPTTRRKVSR